MKRILYSMLLFMMSLGAMADTIGDMLERILPDNGDAQKFEWKISDNNKSNFTISCDGSRIFVEGSDIGCIAVGINWYLQHYAGVDISWNNPKGHLPENLKQINSESHTSSVNWRYYLNFCTHSYSMSFWDWERWQQEIDWMALHGINMPLAITGMECVWKDVLQTSYGYQGLQGVNDFVSGSAYYGWFFMNNLTSWGGPQPESWYEGRRILARKIFKRMTDFGMSPLVPGYVGMIPKNFLTYAKGDKAKAWEISDIVDGGTWCSFTRPAFINNRERLEEFAAEYYAAFQHLYGDVCNTHFYAIDPFHEGGVPSGVTNAQKSVESMWNALKAYDADAVWVCQHWQDNPTTILTHTVPRGRLIILDLHGDNQADVTCSGHHTTASGENHDWIWGQVSNFGGNVGFFGRMDRLISCFYSARDNATQNKLVGIGALPEGIENNSMLYDLLYALPWTSENYGRESWLKDYVFMRYGINAESETGKKLLSAWKKLGAGIYNCPNNLQQGTTESVFLMRPSIKAGTVSSWANSSWYWDFSQLRTALYEMINVSDELKDNDNYKYDLVDLMRQAVADYGKELLDRIQTTSGAERTDLSLKFLELILDQDRILGTRTEFRMGRWTEMARNLGSTESEKNLYEKNARMILTTWGDRAQCENGGLHDYANREWQGLLSSYYYPRWKAFFQNGFAAQNWFQDYEWPFAMGTSGKNVNYLPEEAPYAYGSFDSGAKGDEIETVRNLYKKYFSDFTPEVWRQCVPDLGKTYALTNAEKWYWEADTEGLCLTAPNSDYNGYRLKRAKLPAIINENNGLEYQWHFYASPTNENAVRIENEYLSQHGGASQLCSTPSTTGYPAYTFRAEGTDFLLYQCGNKYYIQEDGKETFMAPDVKWAEACVLVSSSRSATSLLHLNPILSTGIKGLSKPEKRKNDSFYDIKGRRTKQNEKAVYIRNGKKVLL